jgi:hypothetical protein
MFVDEMNEGMGKPRWEMSNKVMYISCKLLE